MATTTRAHIAFPTELLAQLDAKIGPRERSAFVAEATAVALRRHLLDEFIEKSTPIPDKDWDPELVRLGPARWVRKIRSGKSARTKRLEKKLASIK